MTFGDADCSLAGIGPGDVRSRVSCFGGSDLGFAGTRRGDVRSRESIPGGADVVLMRRREVRQGRDAPKTSLMLFFLLEVDDVVEACDAFDDIDVNGGLVVDMAVVCCTLILR